MPCFISMISLKFIEASDLVLTEASLVDPPSNLSLELTGLKQMGSCCERVIGTKLVAADN